MRAISTAQPEFDLWHQPPPPPEPAAAPAIPLVGRGVALRWCQREDVNAISEAVRTGHTHPCCVAATGYGKGPLIAELAGRLRKEAGKVVCTVDRAHLVTQLADEIERHLGVEVGRVADSQCVGLGRGIVVATVQSLYTRDRKDCPLYDYPQLADTRAVIADEAHRFFSDAFRGVLDHFAAGGAVVPMFTATPVATNGGEWGDFVNWTPAAEGPCMRTVGWCIRNGYLVPMTQAFVHVELDLSAIYGRLTGGDEGEDEAAGDELADVLVNLLRDRREKAAASFAAGIADVIGVRQAIVFTPPRTPNSGTETPAKLVASWLNATGRLKCEAVWGGRADKDEVLDSFRRGRPQALSNCALLTEGFNAAATSAVFVCRLLKKWRLLAQCVGRGLRPHPSTTENLNTLDEPGQAAERRRLIASSVKPDCLIADLVGIDGRILQASAIDVLYAAESEGARREIAERTIRKPAQRHGADREADEAAAEEARAAVLHRQHEQLAEMARRRGMAGGIAADVKVTYAGADAGVDMPTAPAPEAHATLGEKAYFLAVSGDRYDIDAAKAIADAKPRKQLKGMTWGMNAALLKAGKKPDWSRARKAYPEWHAQKQREWGGYQRNTG